MLEIPTMELDTRIKDEIEANPALEVEGESNSDEQEKNETEDSQNQENDSNDDDSSEVTETDKNNTVLMISSWKSLPFPSTSTST